jgi:hypothetical protein
MGEILKALDENGLRGNTLVLFTTDHGMPFPRAKCSVYDPGLEIAQILRWPAGGLTGGRVVDGMVSDLDALPMLLETVGAPVPANVQGRSFLPLLRGREQGRDELFAEMTYHDYCLRPCTRGQCRHWRAGTFRPRPRGRAPWEIGGPCSDRKSVRGEPVGADLRGYATGRRTSGS